VQIAFDKSFRPRCFTEKAPIDYVKPAKHAVDDSPENGMIDAPRNCDRQRCTKSDACGDNSGGSPGRLHNDFVTHSLLPSLLDTFIKCPRQLFRFFSLNKLHLTVDLAHEIEDLAGMPK
jgi:hypothetical protein